VRERVGGGLRASPRVDSTFLPICVLENQIDRVERRASASWTAIIMRDGLGTTSSLSSSLSTDGGGGRRRSETEREGERERERGRRNAGP
jgi:hypothetical protein